MLRKKSVLLVLSCSFFHVLFTALSISFEGSAKRRICFSVDIRKKCVNDYLLFFLVGRNEFEFVEDTETLSVFDNRNKLTKYNVYSMRQLAIKLDYHVSSTYKKSGAYEEVTIATKVKGREGVITAFNKLLEDFKSFLVVKHDDALPRLMKFEDVLYTLPHGRGKYQTLFDVYKTVQYQYLMQMRCNLLEPVKCWYEVKKNYV